jgi:TonB-linked SusC/RagA family outer membrane protein
MGFKKNKNMLIELFNIQNYKVLNKYIATCFVLVFTASFNAAANLKNMPSQQIVVTGKVTDQDGIGIPGVTVQVKGTTNTRTTNESGSYSISIPKSGSTLVFTYIGFKTESRLITDQKVANIKLISESTTLDDVVVIGYGSVKRTDLTGSVGRVDMKDIMEAPVGSIEEALAGRVAGVQVSSSDGQPGSRMNIVIRGANSLTQSNAPLYVIDGFPIEDPDIAAINPEDIESYDILKDASATGIYGSRGANGVIVIETKKGKIGKPVINFSTSFGFQQVQKKMKMMSPWDFVNLQNEISPTRTKEIYTRGALDPLNPLYDPNGRTSLEDYRNMKGTDWQDIIFRNALMQSHNVSIRGGNSKTKYSLSGSLFDQQGIISNSGSKRAQGRVTIDQTISKKLRGGITANYSENVRYGQPVNAGGGGTFTSYLLYQAWAYRPVAGTIGLNLEEVDNDDAEYVNPSDLRFSPKVTAENDYTLLNSTNFSSNAYLEYDILKNLKLKITGALSNTLSESKRFYNSQTPQGSPRNNGLARQVNGSYNYSEPTLWSNENYLTYNATIKKHHKLNIVAGLSYQENLNENFGFSSERIAQEYLGMYGLETGKLYGKIAGANEFGLTSVFGRAEYNYKSKYLVTATMRFDGSSKFVLGNKWSRFPSGAVAWNMKNENFLAGTDWLSESKLRIGYGVTGNNRIGSYEFYPEMTYAVGTTYPFNNNGTPPGGIVPSKVGNTSLKWESTEQMNIGYDFGMFKNRLSLTVDYYRKKTNDLLLNAELPSATGFLRTYKNIGAIGNNGLEFTLSTTNIQSKTFTWRSSFNIAFNENKILGLTRNQESLFSLMTVGQNSANLYVSRIGYPAGMFYGFIFDGIYQVEDFDQSSSGKYTLKSQLPTNGSSREDIQPGHIKYKDLNEDGVVDTKDMSIIGRGQPLHTGGFSNNFSYKGFYLNVFLQWSYGNDIFNANRMMFDGNYINLYNVNQYASANERWTEQNRSNTLFKVGGQGPAGNFSDRVIEDGSYLRLKTVSLAYTIPSSFTKRLKVNKISFRVAAQNLLTFTKYTGMDPEVSVRHSVLTPGLDYSPYPQARTITFGLNVTP